MKILKFDSKINFVDKNNVFVGYDLGQCCCEYADWFIGKDEENKVYDEHDNRIEREIPDVADYAFDISYFEEVKSEDLREGNMVRFKLVSDNKPDLYLHIFNCHNGYYHHGFESKIDNKKWKDGEL